MSVAMRQEIERKIVQAIADEAIRTGHTVSVNDGEVWTVSKSTDPAEIMGAVMTTDEDKLRIYDARGERIGVAQIVCRQIDDKTELHRIGDGLPIV